MCPYHRWSYHLDGSLAASPGAADQLASAEHGLIELACEEVSGLIFVSLAATPPPMGEARSLIERAAGVQGLARARVAARRSYHVKANWKLIWENNRECTHCESNHPQYVAANFDRYLDPDHLHEEVATDLNRRLSRLEALGLTPGLFTRTGLAEFPDPAGHAFVSARRTALAAGFVTESLDGRRVAKPMGEYHEPDSGTLRLRSLPNFWCHASFDHAVTTRLMPTGIETTAIEVTWLVDGEAREGVDYELASLLPFWELTSEQDWCICERQQQGVTSRGYRPGPLAPGREDNVERFLAWFGAALRTALA